MLKSTENTLSRDQFVKLREVRQRVKDQFDEDFSLQTENVFNEAYKFALRSETNELFRLVSELNDISDQPIERPLNEEQFVLLREANKLLQAEQGKDLQLEDAVVMDALYAYAKASEGEELLDIYMYLASRKECPPLTTPDMQESSEAGATDLVFEEISAADFERLREAKRSVYSEFDQVLSLHSPSALDDLYGFAVRSSALELFELFCDLHGPQTLSRKQTWQAQDWLTKEQFDLLRDARARVQREFDVELDLRSEVILSDVYQYALRAGEEDLFNLCWEFQRTRSATEASVLPSIDEFRMLRQARALITEEFDQELQLQSEAVENELYKYAVSSKTNTLFDLYTELMALPDRLTPRFESADRAQLSREEFELLRDARDLIEQEFEQHLALENADVLDRLYGFALDSQTEALFDLHAELNGGAAQSPQEPDQLADTDTQSLESPEPTGVFSRLFRKSKPEPTPQPTTEEPPPGEPVALAKAAPAVALEATDEATDAAPLQPPDPAPETESSEPDETVEPTVKLKKDLGDLLVQAMEKERAGATKFRTAPPQTTTTKPAKSAKKPISVQPRQSDLKTTDSNWYVSAETNQMRIRLTGPLAVGVDGELAFSTTGDEPQGAWFDLVDGNPVVAVESADVLVNGEPVDQLQALDSGDKIEVAGQLLQVDFQSGSASGESAISV